MTQKEFREMLKEVAVEYSEHKMYCHETGVEPEEFENYLFRTMLIDKEEAWSPEKLKAGDKYLYVSDAGTIEHAYYQNSTNDAYRKKVGNMYQTNDNAAVALRNIYDF